MSLLARPEENTTIGSSPNLGRSSGVGVSYPGLMSFQQPGKRYIEVHAGEARRIELTQGDLLSIISADGGASALLFPMDEAGGTYPAGLAIEPEAGITLSKFASGARVFDDPAIRSFGEFDDREFSQWRTRNGASDQNTICFPVFDDKTPVGERVALKVVNANTLWVVLPIPQGAIAGGGAGGSLLIEIQSKEKSRSLPDPIGDIRDEFTVSRATARAYEVRKGEYIQVLDVDGQQCSDFMALRADALDMGVERYIDSTVSRSMARGAYPLPGLYDKFFDQDIRPLLRVVQDTVGRHDTFALACTARGYEERGFPGHVNCSDNISDAFDPYGIQRKVAWPAINFFFNSWIDPASGQMGTDESWSRPGDYVLLKALTDLVCVSTACPDDVDPINGWNPTDIHVRIYKPESEISTAVAYRSTPFSEPKMTEKSAFHERTSALTKNYGPARDLWLPMSYEGTGAIEEYWACRQAVTIQDMSSLRKFDILGNDAERLLQQAMTRDVAKLSQHRGTYSLMCDEAGTVIDDGTLFRIGPGVFRWCCGSEESGRHLQGLAEQHGLQVWVKALHSAMPNLAIQGPKSRDLLNAVVFTQPTVPSMDTMKWFGCTVARLNDRDGAPFFLTRTGYTGELGYEIFCGASQAEEVWDALIAAGDEFGLTPMGGEALETIRIEAGLMAANAEFGPGVDAVEAGLGFAIDLRKSEFVGREALAAATENSPKVLIGLRLETDQVPSHGDGVFAGERQVGTVTSATRSPTLECAIAMARVSASHSEINTTLEVGRLDGRMKRMKSRVCEVPFVDPARNRARA